MGHDEGEPPVAEIDDPANVNDVRVVELRDEACLAREAADRLLVVDEPRVDQLDRDLFARFTLASQVDERSPPASELAENLVLRFQGGVQLWRLLGAHSNRAR